jgi:hypothetical protein
LLAGRTVCTSGLTLKHKIIRNKSETRAIGGWHASAAA